MPLRQSSYLYFSSGRERHVACSVAILSLLLRGLRPDQGSEGGGEVAAQQSLLRRNIQQQGQSLSAEARLQDLRRSILTADGSDKFRSSGL